MNKNPATPAEGKGSLPGEALSPDQSFNGSLSAVPKDIAESRDGMLDDMASSHQMDYGEMNEEDARASGYIDDNDQAVSMAKPDVEGSPTGAYTDIGAGRSSVVHSHHEDKSKSSDRPH